MSAVVKADSYGLGSVGASRALAQAGARVFFTATFGEAVLVRKALGEGPQIFVLNGPGEEDAEQYASAKLTPSKPHDAARPPLKKALPAASAGVAGSLGLSTREP